MPPLKCFKVAQIVLKDVCLKPNVHVRSPLALCTKSYVLHAHLPVGPRTSLHMCSIYTPPHKYVVAVNTSPSMSGNKVACEPRGPCKGRQSNVNSLTLNADTSENLIPGFSQYKLDEAHKGKCSSHKKLRCLRTETECKSQSTHNTRNGTSRHISRNAKRKNVTKMAAFGIAGGCLSLKKRRRKDDKYQAENEALLTSENCDGGPSLPGSFSPTCTLRSTHDELDDEPSALESSTCSTLPSTHEENRAENLDDEPSELESVTGSTLPSTHEENRGEKLDNERSTLESATCSTLPSTHEENRAENLDNEPSALESATCSTLPSTNEENGAENLDNEPSALESATCTPSTQDKIRSEFSNDKPNALYKMELFDSERKENVENSTCTSVLPKTNESIVKGPVTVHVLENAAETATQDNANQDLKFEQKANRVGTSPLITKGGERGQKSLIDSAVSMFGIEEQVYNLQFLFDEKRSGKKRKITSSETEDAKKKMERPSHFVAIQISDKTVQKNLKSVQDAVIEGEKRLKPTLISLTSLHLTLLVMRLDDEDELERASQVLRKCYDEVEKDFTQNPVQLEFEGLSHFKRQVLFAKIKPGDAVERVQKLADSMADSFKSAGIPLPGFKDFKPHATIMKLSKAPKLRYKGIKEIKSCYYEDFVDDYFGSQYVNSLQLLSMTKPKIEEGYYHCEKEYIFDIPEGLCSCVESRLNRTELLREEVSSSKEEVKRKISDLTRKQLEAKDKT